MMRILVIDGDADVREAVRAILEGAGYAVDLAADGELGLVLQRARPADVVISDAPMPSGFPQARVIAVPKPFVPDELLRAVRALLH